MSQFKITTAARAAASLARHGDLDTARERLVDAAPGAASLVSPEASAFLDAAVVVVTLATLAMALLYFIVSAIKYARRARRDPDSADGEPPDLRAEHSVRKLIYKSGLHAGALFWRSWLLLGAAVAWSAFWLIEAGFGAPGFGVWDGVTTVMMVVFAIIGVIMLALDYLQHRGVEIVVTTHGLVRRRKRLFSWREETVLLHAVEALAVRQDLLGMVLGFGAVIVRTGDRDYEWDNLINPRRVAAEIEAHHRGC